MYCRSPYIKGGFPFPCGNCFPCKMNKRRTWAHRIMLEAASYDQNSLVTLTYDENEMPRLEDGRGTLVYEDAQLFLKRLRVNVERHKQEYISKLGKFRFFCVGEYGGRYERPHFHMVLFNFRPCANYVRGHRVGPDSVCCPQCMMLYSTWKKGMITNETFGLAGAEYVSQYAVKKMTREDDIRLKGRRPEFARMSLKPGLGHDFMWEVASTLLQYPEKLEEMVDVPASLRMHGKKWPIGRYLRRKLREFVGREPDTPPEVMEEILAELQPLQEEAERRLAEAKVKLPESYDAHIYAKHYREVILEQKAQLVASAEARFEIFKMEGNL